MRHLLPLPKLSYGFSETPFGECCIVFNKEVIWALTFAENHETALIDINKRFPKTILDQNDEKTSNIVRQIFVNGEKPCLQLVGSSFQLSVWHALEQIPAGTTSSYAQIAKAIGHSKAVRAVGTAIGANPIAFLIPCHRVIRSDGSLGGYRWGLECKKKILEWEKKTFLIELIY